MRNIPTLILEILSKINENGYEAYLVGGAVRDLFLNKESKDYDLCTNMPLTKVQELFPHFHLMKPNTNRNTGVMRIGTTVIEISEFKGKTLKEDLSKRDFTINAMALDKDGNLTDLYNGIESLNSKQISLTQKDGSAFQSNPLQILRAIRIGAKLNFEIDENCHNKMIENKHLLETIAVERIYSELIQLLITDNPAKYIRDNLEVIFTILPELKPMHNFEQKNPWHIYDVLEHTLKALESTEKNIFIRLAVLFHDIGKPKSFFTDKNGVGHFYGHPKISVEMFLEIAKRLKMDNKTKRVVTQLIEKHDVTLSAKPEKIYEFIKEFGIECIPLLFAVKRSDNKGQNPEMTQKVLEELDILEELYNEYILRFNNLQINSSKLIEMGYKSKKLKIVLEDVRKQIVTQQLGNTEQEITDYITKKFHV